MKEVSNEESVRAEGALGDARPESRLDTAGAILGHRAASYPEPAVGADESLRWEGALNQGSDSYKPTLGPVGNLRLFVVRALGVQPLANLYRKWRRKRQQRREVRLIETSAFFDQEWYLTAYPDVATAGVEPAIHYLAFGASEGRDPHPEFHTEWYLREYADVREAGMNPLVHYVRFGAAEGRSPNPQPGSTKSELSNAVRSPHHAGEKVRIERVPSVVATLARMARNTAPPAIVIPVYNAPEHLDACLMSVIHHTREPCRVIIIDDASPDPRVGELLGRYDDSGRIELYRNAENLGFTRTVNKGIELAGRSDVVFLNSDTEVTPGWLRNLRLAAYSGERVGTATPLSNNAGAFSAPEFDKANDLPSWLSLDDYGRGITQKSPRDYPATPTGHGFCIYVRRDCIDEVGRLDAGAFPRGYGEENDFCMRAGRRGWHHVIDDATLIYHARSASFGLAKADLVKAGRAVVNDRYPEYTTAIREFVASEPLKEARKRVGDSALAFTVGAPGPKPRLLFVLSTSTGGTPQTSEDLMLALDERIDAFVLRCNSSILSLMRFRDGSYVELEAHSLSTPLTAFPHRSDEYDGVVAEWLVRYAIELVHIRHIAWHGLGLIDVAKGLGLPVVFSFHDFYTVCPTVKLLDERLVFCGGRCTASVGECRHELWTDTDFPALKNAAIHRWQGQIGAVLARCDLFITTSASAKKTIIDSYPLLADRPFHVIPHGRDFPAFESLAASFNREEVVRILVPGNISGAKGGAVIAELGRLSASAGVELHVLGTVESDVQLPDSVVKHGKYRRSEIAEKVRAINPHVGGVFSIWPETHCHTLTELWACGVPVIGFDFGAVGDRIRESGGGWLPMTADAAGVSKVIELLRADPAEHQAKMAAVRSWQRGTGRLHDSHYMGHAYFDLYAALMVGSVSPVGAAAGRRRPQVALLTSRAKVANYKTKMAAGSAYVRLLEKTRDSLHRKVRYDMIPSGADLDWLTDRYDATLVQRTALDRDAARELIRMSQEKNRPIIIDLDDDLLDQVAPSGIGEDSADNIEALRTLLGAADLITVSTERLKSRIAPLASPVVVEPNAVSARLWLAPLPPSVANGVLPENQQRKSDREVRAVYFGTRTHAADLSIVRNAVARVRESLPDFRLFTVGVTDAAEDWHEPIAVPSAHRTYPAFVPWARSVFSTMDFGIAPLVDSPFNRSKSELKFLEYAAAKLACVASNVGPYRDAMRHGETGLLADNTIEAWTECLLFAATRRDALAAMVTYAHAEVLTRHLVYDREAPFDAAIIGSLPAARTLRQ